METLSRVGAHLDVVGTCCGCEEEGEGEEGGEEGGGGEHGCLYLWRRGGREVVRGVGEVGGVGGVW